MNNYIILVIVVYIFATIAEIIAYFTKTEIANDYRPFFMATIFCILAGFGYYFYLTR